MSSVEENDKLTIAFTGKLDNGTIFMEVDTDNPMQVILGNSELPPTIEIGVIGMKQGETRKIRVDPDEGYGPRLKDLVHEVPLKNFEGRLDVKPGMLLSQKIEHEGEEKKVPATVIEVTDDKVVLDYNHPLAGHHLTYELTVLDIEKGT